MHINFQGCLAKILFVCMLTVASVTARSKADDLSLKLTGVNVHAIEIWDVRHQMKQLHVAVDSTAQSPSDPSSRTTSPDGQAQPSQPVTPAHEEESPPPSPVPWIIILIVVLVAGVGLLFHKMSKER